MLARWRKNIIRISRKKWPIHCRTTTFRGLRAAIQRPTTFPPTKTCRVFRTRTTRKRTQKFVNIQKLSKILKMDTSPDRFIFISKTHDHLFCTPKSRVPTPQTRRFPALAPNRRISFPTQQHKNPSAFHSSTKRPKKCRRRVTGQKTQ